jgi:ABC-type transport system involved in cytochrome c biogenesis permease subunit
MAVLMAGSFFVALLAITFNKASAYKTGQYLLILAFLLLTAFGIIRWSVFGHPPFVTLFESMLTSIWFTILIYLLIRLFAEKLTILLLPVSFFSFLLMGWSASLAKEASPLSATLSNVWLFIHASFATSGAASFLIAASFSIIYLMGSEWLLSSEKVASKIPEYESLPKTILNFILFGLILWGVMIVSGSIWAHVAWGRYWAWDPIELWSLISWLLYGLLLHARLAFKLSRRLFCWMTIVAALTVAFSLWGVGYLYETIHNYG